MDVELMVLCDAATDYSGKLNILGTFDSIYAVNWPATHPHCALALRVRFDRMEEGAHKIRINFIDDDGKPIINAIEGNININFGGEDDSVVSNLIINLQGLKFERAGRYSIDLAVDGRSERSIPLHLKQMQKR